MVKKKKNLPANAGDSGDVRSVPGPESFPGRGNISPLQYSCLGKSHRQRSLLGYSPWNPKELDATEHARILGAQTWTILILYFLYILLNLNGFPWTVSSGPSFLHHLHFSDTPLSHHPLAQPQWPLTCLSTLFAFIYSTGRSKSFIVWLSVTFYPVFLPPSAVTL